MHRCGPALLAILAACAQPADLQRLERLNEMERAVFQAVNAERTSRGLVPLRWNEAVAVEAREHASNLAARRFFSHEDPVRGNLAQRLTRKRIRWRMCAENIFNEKGYKDPVAEAVRGWMKSPGHRQNILDPQLTETGTGVAVGPDETWYFVQIFITPWDRPAGPRHRP